MQAASPSGQPIELDSLNAEFMTSANELQSALKVDPARLQRYINKMLGRGKHNVARAQRAKARIAKRKAKRKA